MLHRRRTKRFLAFHPLPAVGREPLLRQETALVVHFARALDPIAEVDVRKPNRARARGVVENHEGAARARRLGGVKTRIDHGDPASAHLSAPHPPHLPAPPRLYRRPPTP